MENYVDYIAKRPRAQRFGSHGLFTGSKANHAAESVWRKSQSDHF